MSVFKDLTGQRFGRLVVESFHRSDKEHKYWICRCDCGKQKIVRTSNLKSGAVKSCGCLLYETQMKNREKAIKHGCSHKERLYETWKNMKRRCYDTTNKRADFYCNKGVVVCEEWKEDYLAFKEWAMSNGYKENLTLDRIDNNGNYEPSNCRWATAKIQANNQSRNHHLTYNGETHTMAEWADILGFTYTTINNRVQRGWSVERIITTPQRRRVNGHYII